MFIEHCFWGVKFIELDGLGEKIFGFPEFLTGVAMIVLAWTISDARYKFRVETAPIPVLGISFYMIAILGFLTLLTDLWKVEHWWVPAGNIFTPSTWQAFLGGLLLMTLFTWLWFAFIKPPKYGRSNAFRFANTIYRYTFNGSPTELQIVADELRRSIPNIIKFAPAKEDQIQSKSKKRSKVADIANDLLLLLADRRMCRAIINSAPGTAMVIFKEISEQHKYRINIGVLGKNLINEAFINKNSFLFHETEGYQSGLLGYQKPLSNAIYGNHTIVDSISTLFDVNYEVYSNWDAEQFEAFCRVVLIAIDDCVVNNILHINPSLYRALDIIKGTSSILTRMNNLNEIDKETYSKIDSITKFIEKSCVILDRLDIDDVDLKKRYKTRTSTRANYFDELANIAFKLIVNAGDVKTPRTQCWWVQHNLVWGELFGFNRLNGKSGALVIYKVKRLMQEEVVRMEKFPNFQGARVVAICLNVMGFEKSSGTLDKYMRDFHRWLLWWLRKNFNNLFLTNSNVGKECLVEGVEYDALKRYLVKTYPANGLRVSPAQSYLYVK